LLSIHLIRMLAIALVPDRQKGHPAEYLRAAHKYLYTRRVFAQLTFDSAYTAAAPIAQIWMLKYLPYSPAMQRILATSVRPS
jgi:hypothetical protein